MAVCAVWWASVRESGFTVTDVRVALDESALKAFFESEDGGVARALLGLASQVELRAKRYCAVDTGRLRSSIAQKLVTEEYGLVALGGTNVEYAVYVEYGTQFMEARSFLRRALQEVVK